MSSAIFGSIVPLASKEDQEEALTKFLLDGYELVQAEPETLQWYASKIEGPSPPMFNIFDTFPSREGRKVHFDGPIPKGLGVHGPTLLRVRPDVSKIMVDVLTSKVAKVGQGQKAGLTVGLWVVFTAQPDKRQAVRDFLVNALPLVEAESGTASWYAVHWPDTDNFCILDFFATDEARNAHLNGKVAAALFASVDELLTGTPSVTKLEVLAAHITI